MTSNSNGMLFVEREAAEQLARARGIGSIFADSESFRTNALRNTQALHIRRMRSRARLFITDSIHPVINEFYFEFTLFHNKLACSAGIYLRGCTKHTISGLDLVGLVQI